MSDDTVTEETKEEFDPNASSTFDDVVPGKKGTELDKSQTVLEGFDDGLIRSNLCVAFNEKPEDIPDNFWNKNHRFVDIAAMSQSWRDTRAELDRMRQEYRVPKEYQLNDNMVGFFGRGVEPDQMVEAAAKNETVQSILTGAKNLGLSQKQLNGVTDMMLDLTVGESYRRSEEQKYIDRHGGDELRAGQRMSQIATHNNAVMRDEKLGRHRNIITQMMSCADGRDFLESVYSGQLNPFIRSQVTRKETEAVHREAVSEASIKAYMRENQSAYDKKDPVVRKKVEAMWTQLYGDKEYTPGTM